MTIVNYDDIYFWMEDSQSERYINYDYEDNDEDVAG